MMERLYNPALMSDEELRATFVARQPLIDELLALIEHQPDGAGVQHIVLIGSRGMGKTTVLLRLRLAIKERGLDAHWQSVCFPEESYAVTDLADLWLETLKLLATETNDSNLEAQVNRLTTEYPNVNDLQEAAFAVLKDWRRQHQKRLVLLVDNLDLILEQMNDEQNNAELRNVLMNDGTLMLVSGATTFFQEAHAYDQPLYNFFKIYNLSELQFSEIQDLLRQRAARDQIPDFERKLTHDPSRLRTLIYFTGGNPRLLLMLYQVVTQSDFVQVRAGLEKLLDEVTPYYKAKTESLPAQQRKILDHIARESAITREGVTPTTIATALRLSANQMSSQLKRLADLGYVRAANLRERSSYYALAEPLYAIWYQMRFGRDARQRMQWLVSFLQVWYEDADIGSTGKQLELRFREYMDAGHVLEARGVLEHRRYLAEVVKDSSLRASEMDDVVRGYLDLKDFNTLTKEILPGLKLEHFSPGTLLALQETECISKQEVEQALLAISQSPANPAEVKGMALFALSSVIIFEKPEAAILYLDRGLEMEREVPRIAWILRGSALSKVGRHEEAVISYDRALALDPNNDAIHYLRGLALDNLGRYEEAIASYDRAVKIEPDMDEAWNNRGNAFFNLGRYEEAISSYHQAIAIKPEKANTWNNHGNVLITLGRYEEAICSCDRAVAIEPEKNDAWYNRGIALAKLGRYEEAISSYDRAVAIKPEDEASWNNRGIVYLQKSLICIGEGNRELATLNWREAWRSVEHAKRERWYEVASTTLLFFAHIGQMELARHLLTEAQLEEPLFPLARALDYLLTGDEALLEKLSPEVKKLVEEMVGKLRSVGKPTKRASTAQRIKKARSGPRHRTAKQLR